GFPERVADLSALRALKTDEYRTKLSSALIVSRSEDFLMSKTVVKDVVVMRQFIALVAPHRGIHASRSSRGRCGFDKIDFPDATDGNFFLLLVRRRLCDENGSITWGR